MSRCLHAGNIMS